MKDFILAVPTSRHSKAHPPQRQNQAESPEKNWWQKRLNKSRRCDFFWFSSNVAGWWPQRRVASFDIVSFHFKRKIEKEMLLIFQRLIPAVLYQRFKIKFTEIENEKKAAGKLILTNKTRFDISNEICQRNANHITFKYVSEHPAYS